MKIGKLRQVNGFWNNLTFTGNMCRMRSALTNYLSEEGLKSRIEDGLVLFEFDDNHFCASFCMDEGYPECEITYEVEDGFTGGICTLFLNLFFNPCHQYCYCILLFFSGQLSSGRYMMPFGETTTATAARSPGPAPNFGLPQDGGGPGTHWRPGCRYCRNRGGVYRPGWGSPETGRHSAHGH